MMCAIDFDNFFFSFFFFYSEMKMNPTKTIFNMTEDQEFVRVQWTKKYCDLLPLLICVHKCLHCDFYMSIKPSVCDEKQIILHC